MSLGFLTESALLPSKAKPIKVDSKSLVDLRAVVFQKEQERQERKRALAEAATDSGRDAASSGSASARGFGRFAHLKATKTRGSSSNNSGNKSLDRASNRGVDKRRRQDEAAHELDARDDDDRATHRKSHAMLVKKAKLYDAMMRGDTASSSASTAVAADYLVDFGAKQRLSNGDSHASASSGVTSSTDTVEITDEFGRTRVVTANSAAHIASLERSAAPASGTDDSTVTMTLQRPHRYDDHAADAVDDDAPASSSFVTSQWEARLNKTYVQEVHEHATLAKATAPLSKATRKQQRLEKLRQQQQLVANTSDAPRASSGRDEHVVAAQATAFLNDLGALL